MSTVFVINSDQMGHGDRELGRKILATCLTKLRGFRDLDAVVLYNSGVLLAKKDSYVAAQLLALEEASVDVLPCGTCAQHFDIGDDLVVDRISNMDEILSAIQKATKVVTL